jgi:5,10-methylenetetrahydromethanopterin reductase
MSVRFGLRIPPCADVRDVAATARAAEEADFDVAWLPDSQFLWRDVWAAMALAATTTDRIALGTCVTQFETRHATVTAAAAATIDEIAPRRRGCRQCASRSRTAARSGPARRSSLGAGS